MEDGPVNNQYQLSAAAILLTPDKTTERMRSLSPAQVAQLESHEKHNCFKSLDFWIFCYAEIGNSFNIPPLQPIKNH